MTTLLSAYAAATTTTTATTTCIMIVDDRIVHTFSSMCGLSLSFLGRYFDVTGSQAYVVV